MFFSHSYSFSLAGLLQKQLSELVWLLIPCVSQRYRRFSSWSMPLDCFSLTFVSSSLSSLCNAPNCPYSEAASNLFICLPESNKAPSLCTDLTAASQQQWLLSWAPINQSRASRCQTFCPTSSICPLQLSHPTHCEEVQSQFLPSLALGFQSTHLSLHATWSAEEHI